MIITSLLLFVCGQVHPDAVGEGAGGGDGGGTERHHGLPPHLRAQRLRAGQGRRRRARTEQRAGGCDFSRHQSTS